MSSLPGTVGRASPCMFLRPVVGPLGGARDGGQPTGRSPDETSWYRASGRFWGTEGGTRPVGTDRGRPRGLGGEDGRGARTGRTSWHRPRGGRDTARGGPFYTLGGWIVGRGRPTDQTGLRPVATVPTRGDQLAPSAAGGGMRFETRAAGFYTGPYRSVSIAYWQPRRGAAPVSRRVDVLAQGG